MKMRGRSELSSRPPHGGLTIALVVRQVVTDGYEPCVIARSEATKQSDWWGNEIASPSGHRWTTRNDTEAHSIKSDLKDY